MTIPADLALALTATYPALGLTSADLQAEPESAEYDAYRFNLSGARVVFRSAKITPTKTGQFVTLWKRIGDGPIQPFDDTDPIDLIIVSCRSGDLLGQFVFPPALLRQQNVVTHDGKEGKRAIRVYPPWDQPTSKQALKTQRWQTPCFVEIKAGQAQDPARAKQLLG